MLVSQTGSAADYSAPTDWGRGGIASWSGDSRPYVALKREERLAAVDSAFSLISLVPPSSHRTELMKWTGSPS